MVVQVFALGQQSGRLEEMLDRLATTYDQQCHSAAHAAGRRARAAADRPAGDRRPVHRDGHRSARSWRPAMRLIMRDGRGSDMMRRAGSESSPTGPGRGRTPSLRHVVGRPRHAFSLVEIMIVVVIIGLLAGVVTYATTGYLDKAKRQRARADISVFAGAVDSYYLANGRFPDNRDGLKALVPQLHEVLQKDPWGHDYLYVQPGKNGTVRHHQLRCRRPRRRHRRRRRHHQRRRGSASPQGQRRRQVKPNLSLNRGTPEPSPPRELSPPTLTFSDGPRLHAH